MKKLLILSTVLAGIVSCDLAEDLNEKEPEGQHDSLVQSVDLGLSVKWAECNMGASKPEEYGDYYASGETEPKKIYGWSTYKYCESSTNTLTKYCSDLSYGTVDFKNALEPSDDVAHIKLGDNWRMPTEEEWKELLNKDNCSWTWETDYNGTGVPGYIIRSKISGYTDKHIFLPAAGWREDEYAMNSNCDGSYSSLNMKAYNAEASIVRFSMESIGWAGTSCQRCFGYSVRPVYGDIVPVSSLSLNESTLTLIKGQTEQLEATIFPDNASNKAVFWTSSECTVANVDESGFITALNPGCTTITAVAANGDKTACCSVTVEDIAVTTPEYVDLGLSVKWATCNIGASRPEEYGDYYAWGGVETRERYDASTYEFYNYDSYDILTGYCVDSDYGIIDNKTVLEPDDDAAHVKFGDIWRMPTDEEWAELRNTDNCSWTWTSSDYNGTAVSGYIVRSKKPGYTGNLIFLPAAGYREMGLKNAGSNGYYWSSSLNTDRSNAAWSIVIDSKRPYRTDFNRDYGQSVRPVYGVPEPVSSLSLNKDALSLKVGQIEQLTATVLPGNATNKNIIWTSSENTVASVDKNGYIRALKQGCATISAIAGNGTKTSCCSVTVKTDDKSTLEYVDLGLSVKWATCNIGASRPEEYGRHYAWGETEPGTNDWANYKWCNGTETSLTKYCTKSSNGTVDNKTVLEPDDDVAQVKLGGNWRMPTEAEWEELMNADNCQWIWVSSYYGTGVAGYMVESKKAGYTDMQIFLPAAGYRDYGWSLNDEGRGYYWSSSLNTSFPSCAAYASLHSKSGSIGSNSRCYGYSVRPVLE